MTERVGYIPESIIYICQDPTTFKTCWDGGNWSDDEGVIHQQTVIPTFPVSGDKKNLDSRLTTARRWANFDNPSVPSSAKDVAKQIIRKNKPFTIQVCGLEIRSQGGRAYKVIDAEGHLFDLREDVVFEAMMAYGAKPGGYLSCEFLWCMSGSSMKLIREGSLLHQAIIRANERREKAPVPVTDLKPGHVYRTKNLAQKIFVGWLPAPKSKQQWKMVWFNTYGEINRDRLNQLLANTTYWPQHSISGSHTMVEGVEDISDLSKVLKDFLIECNERHIATIQSQITAEENRSANEWRSWGVGTPDALQKYMASRKKHLSKLEKELETLKGVLLELPSATVKS